MLTVPEAARRMERHPETIRRWIRSGKLRARKVGTQHVIDEHDLDELLLAPDDAVAYAPDRWGWDRRMQRLAVGLLRDDRERGH